MYTEDTLNSKRFNLVWNRLNRMEEKIDLLLKLME